MRPLRTELRARLGDRRLELEEAAWARAQAIADPAEIDDPEYLERLRATVAAAVSYALAALEAGAGTAPPVPSALREQARYAARCGVSLDTVLRRYFAGFLLFGDFLVAESDPRKPLSSSMLKEVLQEQAALFDRFVTVISIEHSRARRATAEERRLDMIQRLLAGEPADRSQLGYELDQVHVALVAAGEEAASRVRDLGRSLDRQVLSVRSGGAVLWAWLGGRRKVEHRRVAAAVAELWDGTEAIALGEPAESLEGWRLSHRQARAAFPLATSQGAGFVRYGDAALLASALRDKVFLRSLRSLYLEPLAQERDRGESLRSTLRAYFAANRNLSSTAAALGVHRHTVTNRLRLVEECIRAPLESRAAQLEVALRLEELHLLGVDQSGDSPGG